MTTKIQVVLQYYTKLCSARLLMSSFLVQLILIRFLSFEKPRLGFILFDISFFKLHCLKYFGNVVIGVARKEDKILMIEMVILFFEIVSVSCCMLTSNSVPFFYR